METKRHLKVAEAARDEYTLPPAECYRFTASESQLHKSQITRRKSL